MQSKNIIFNSLRESFSIIWKNKLLFLSLFILQIAFFVVFSAVNIKYQTKILENTKAITDYLSQQKLDEASATDAILQQKNILGDDPLMISENFDEIVKNFRLYLGYVFILLIFFISIAWAITYRLLKKTSLRQLTNIFLKNIVILLFYLGLIFTFFFLLLNVSITQLAEQSSMLFAKYSTFLIVSIILAYFMFISIAIANHIKLKNIVQKTLSIGIRKAHYVLSVYFINIFLLFISMSLLYYFIEKNPFILLLSLILFVFSFVFGRILIINVVEKLKA
ncbi:hypothetical protein J4234_01380 [Candidatus Woesearchaeota archaeon]|nr:hypothetical protein [Candidatus Woesearchaeota archaeon]